MDKTVPPGRVKGTLTPPCSKSYAQRALAAALLSEEVSVLRNIEFCDDTRSALQCIETLGARVRRVDPTSLSIEGGLSPKGCVLNVGESGLSTRLFTPVASLCPTPVTIEGRGSLLRRPMQMMFEPLRRLGVRVRDNGGFLPIEVCGPIQGGEAEVDGSVSSQFITGLLLALPLARRDTSLHVRGAVSTPYLDMTLDTAARFGIEISQRDYEEFYIPGRQRYRSTYFSIEGDWSAAAMLLVAGATAGEVTVRNASMLSKQADTAICTALVRAGAAVINEEDSVTALHRPLRAFEFDATNCPDLFPALAALAVLMGYVILFSNSSEGHTYVITLIAYQFWYWSMKRGGALNTLDRIVYWATFIVVVVMPVDVICPMPVMEFFYGWQLNLWLLLYLWLRICWTTFIRTPESLTEECRLIGMR